jgi:hypothetical protein
MNAFDLSAGVFVRGLTNLKAQLTKAEDTGSSLLEARLGPEVPGSHPADLHQYTLAAHVHWAAEGARLAIAQLLGEAAEPAPSDAKSFGDLHRKLDATIAYLRAIAPSALEAGLERTIEHRRGSIRASGSQFLTAFAIPHFYYHLTTTYGILRNQGVRLTMGDFLGNWAT